MRLIDADALECDAEWSEYADDYISYSKFAIDNATTIDAVPVVRCKDCRWWDKTDNGFGYCHAEKHCHISAHWEISIFRTYRGDHFCAEGERKGELNDNAE